MKAEQPSPSDRNECEEWNVNSCDQKCENTDGSYKVGPRFPKNGKQTKKKKRNRHKNENPKPQSMGSFTITSLFNSVPALLATNLLDGRTARPRSR